MQSFKRFAPLLIIFLSGFFITLGYFLTHPQLEHHEYVRLIEQNIKGCQTWNCYKFNVSDYNLRGFIFFKYWIAQFLGLFKIKNALFSTWILTSFCSGFFIAALSAVFDRFEIKGKKKVFSFFVILLFFPLLIKEILTGEDNISYYGLILCYFLFLFESHFNEVKDGLIAGVFLSLSLFVHTSPLIFLFLIFICPLAFFLGDIPWRKIAISSLSSLVLYCFLWQIINLDQPIEDIYYTLKNSPLFQHILSAVTLRESPAAATGPLMTLVFYGFDEMTDHFSERGHTIWLSIILWLSLIFIFILSLLKEIKNRPGYVVTLGVIFFLTLGPIVLYEPHVGERWDFLILFLIFVFISMYKYHRSRRIDIVVLILVFLHSPNALSYFFSKSHYDLEKKSLVREFKALERSFKDSEYFIFPIKYLSIEPIVLSNLPGLEGKILFYDEGLEKFYRTYMSSIALGEHSFDKAWELPIFRDWHLEEKPLNPISSFEVPPPCEWQKDKIYFYGDKSKLFFKCLE